MPSRSKPTPNLADDFGTSGKGGPGGNGVPGDGTPGDGLSGAGTPGDGPGEEDQRLGRSARLGSLSKGARWGLAVLLILAFGLRLWNVHAMEGNPRFNAPVMDALYHLDWAEAINAGEVFQEDAYFRAPLYPWLMAAVLKVGGDSLYALRLVQCLLGTLTVFLVWRIGRRSFGPLAGWVSGVLAATYWISIYFDGELLIPTLYVPLLLLALEATLNLKHKGYHPKACALAGLWFGLAALARPNVLLFMPFLFFWLLLRKPPRRFAAGVALTLGTIAPILPITVRNWVVSGEPVLIATQAGVNFWIGNNPKSDGMSAVVPGTRAGWWEGYEDSRRLAKIEAGSELSSAQISAHYSKKAWSWMAENPAAAVRHWLWKTRLFFMDWELSNNQEIRFISHRFNPLSRVSIGFGVLLGLAGIGLVLGLRRRSGETFPLWGFLVVYSASVIAFFVCSRFRVPVLPVMMLFAGHGVAQSVHWARTKRWVPLVSALAGACLLAFLSGRLPKRLLTGDSLGYLALGSHAMEQGNLDQAEAFLEAGLESSTGNKHLRLAWGILLSKREQAEAARIWLYESLQMFPDYPELRAHLVTLENDQKNYREALSMAEAGLRMAPAQVNLLYSRGFAWNGLEQKEKALADFQRVVDLKPDHVMGLISLGLLHKELGNEGAAREALQRATPLLDSLGPEWGARVRFELQALGSE